MSSPLEDVSSKTSYNTQVTTTTATTKSGNDIQLQNQLKGNGTTASESESYTVKELEEKQKRTVQELEQALKDIISEYEDLSLAELKSFLDYCGYDEKKLTTMSDDELEKLSRCICQAVGFSRDENGKINKKELPFKILAFKFCMVDQNMGSSKAIEEVKKAENKDFFDILQDKVNTDPKLERLKKYLGKRKVNDLTAEELKEIFKKVLNHLLDPKKQKTPEAYIDFFMVSINKCEPKDKAKIFHAFALLLKDKDMKNIVPDMYKKLIATYGDAKKLVDFINKLGPEIMEMMGFDKAIISQFNLEALKDLDDAQLKEIVDVFLSAFQNIPEEDLPILKEALQIKDPTQLQPQHIEILKKHGKLIQDTVKLIATTAQDPELVERLAKHFEPLRKYLQELELDTGIATQIQIYFEENPDIFGQMPENDLIKAINRFTNNKFSEVIGDTNPDNLYNEALTENNNTVTYNNNEQYGYSTVSEETYTNALSTVSDLTSRITADNDTEEFTIETKQTRSISQQAAASNGKLFDEAWAQGVIDIKYLGQNFNNACTKAAQKVWNFLDRNQQNRLNFLKNWHNTELSSKAAERYDMDKDEIEQLELSIGETRFLQNRYDQLHRNEKES